MKPVLDRWNKPVTLTATGTTVSQVLDVYPEVLGVSAPSVIAIT